MVVVVLVTVWVEAVAREDEVVDGRLPQLVVVVVAVAVAVVVAVAECWRGDDQAPLRTEFMVRSESLSVEAE